MIPHLARPWALSQLAETLGVEWRGDAGYTVERASDLGTAGQADLAPLYDRKLIEEALASAAGALVVSEELAERFAGRNLLVSAVPKACFAHAVSLIHPKAPVKAGVHETAVVDPSATVPESVSIGPNAVIGARCRLGERVVIGAGSVLLDEVEVHDEAVIHPRVVLYSRTIVGARSAIFSGAVIGAPGFGHASDETGRARSLPHLGRVVIAEDVEVGANSTVDRATFGETRLGDRVRLDNLVQIAHNVHLGPDCMLASQSGVAGSSRLGRGVLLGGGTGVRDHVTIGDGAAVVGKSGVFHDIEAGEIFAGIPAMPASLWRRITAVQRRLPALWADLRRLMKESGLEDR